MNLHHDPMIQFISTHRNSGNVTRGPAFTFCGVNLVRSFRYFPDVFEVVRQNSCRDAKRKARRLPGLSQSDYA